MQFTPFDSMEKLSETSKSSKATASIAAAYALFLGTGGIVYHYVAEGEVSVLCTLSVMLQLVSYVMLGIKISNAGSAAGISARTLMLSAVSHCCRLSSTLFFSGYLPVDASGDWIYQVVDIVSLGMVGYLLYTVLQARRATYQEADDATPIWPMLLGAFVCACMFHADMNHSAPMDIMWFTGLYIDACAMLPQIWLIAKNGAVVEAMLSHHIFTLVASRLLSGYFWWLAAEDILYTPWMFNVSLGGWSIILGHVVHFLLLADIVYTYVKACLLTGIPGLGGSDIVCTEV